MKVKNIKRLRGKNIEVFIGGAPLLESRLCEGLLEFGETHPQWSFSLRSANFRYSKRWLNEHRVDGVLVLIDASPVEKVLNKASVPWVHLLPRSGTTSAPNVGVDDRSIGRMGAEFFLSNGWYRTVFLCVGTSWSKERGHGFRERLMESDRKCEIVEIPFSSGEDWGFAPGVESLLARWVRKLSAGVAIMAAHDILANRLVDTCLRRGLRIPRDISILGVGNHDLPCRISPVQISSIDADVPEVSRRGAALLERILTGEKHDLAVRIPPTKVVERKSTGQLYFGDDRVVRLVSYIREHACEGLQLEQLQAVVPMGKRTLSRLFAKYVGHSPGREIRLARLRRARELLTNPSYTLTEIAHACSYSDLSHMNREFQAEYRLTPGALRR